MCGIVGYAGRKNVIKKICKHQESVIILSKTNLEKLSYKNWEGKI